MRQSLIAVLACVALSVACDNSGDSSSTSPTPVVRTTDTFTGTVQPMNSDTHKFTVLQAGQVDVTLTAATYPAYLNKGARYAWRIRIRGGDNGGKENALAWSKFCGR